MNIRDDRDDNHLIYEDEWGDTVEIYVRKDSVSLRTYVKGEKNSDQDRFTVLDNADLEHLLRCIKRIRRYS